MQLMFVPVYVCLTLCDLTHLIFVRPVNVCLTRCLSHSVLLLSHLIFVTLNACPTPCLTFSSMSNSLFVQLDSCPTWCFSHSVSYSASYSVFFPHNFGPAWCLSHLVFVPLSDCPTQCFSNSIFVPLCVCLGFPILHILVQKHCIFVTVFTLFLLGK